MSLRNIDVTICRQQDKEDLCPIRPYAFVGCKTNMKTITLQYSNLSIFNGCFFVFYSFNHTFNIHCMYFRSEKCKFICFFTNLIVPLQLNLE